MDDETLEYQFVSSSKDVEIVGLSVVSFQNSVKPLNFLTVLTVSDTTLTSFVHI